MNQSLKFLILSLLISPAAFAGSSADVSMNRVAGILDMSKTQRAPSCSYLEDGSWLGIKTTYKTQNDNRVREMEVIFNSGDVFKKKPDLGYMNFTVAGWVGLLSFEPSRSKNKTCKVRLQTKGAEKGLNGKIDCAMSITDESVRSGDDHVTNTNLFKDPHQEPDGLKIYQVKMDLKNCTRRTKSDF